MLRTNGFRYGTILVDQKGQQVENITEQAFQSAPYQRSINRAGYWSRAPGGGPAVKRRIPEKDLDLKLQEYGKRSFKVVPILENQIQNTSSRQLTKARLLSRWEKRTTRTPESTSDRVIELLKIECEKNGITNIQEIQFSIDINLETIGFQPIVIIWGPPYAGQAYQVDLFSASQPEGKMANDIRTFIDRLKNAGLQCLPIILYADVYGQQINKLEQKQVDEYGRTVAENTKDFAVFVPWSRLRQENWSAYQAIADSINLTNCSFELEIQRARQILTRTIGNPSAEQIKTAAMQYMRERMIEGKLLTQGFYLEGLKIENPLKIGTAQSRSNDDPYEPDLPRIYLKNISRAAWNKGRKYE